MRLLLTAIAAGTLIGASAQDLSDIGAALEAAGCYRAKARCEIYLPNAEHPVVYDLQMQSSATPADTLSVCDYLIDWRLATPGGHTSTGFASYAAGDHFRYRDGKLQEYHYGDNPAPFAPGGRVADGVQARAQFADFLPQPLGRAFRAMAADTADYVCNIERRGQQITVRGVERVRGYDSREYTYVLDADTYLPVSVEYISNPGAPSEQTLSMSYLTLGTDSCRAITEEMLADTYHDAFSKYRRDTYRLEHLPGQKMPAFSIPTPTGERYTYNSGEPMGVATVIAVLDSSVAGTPEVVKELREACLLSSVACKLILAFVDTDTDAIDAATGSLQLDEAILFNARSLSRDCGVAVYPSVIICRPDGTVADVIIGRNNQLRADVLQKLATTTTSL